VVTQVVTTFCESTSSGIVSVPTLRVCNITEWRLYYLQDASLVALIDLTYGVPVFPVRIIAYRNMQ